MQRRSATRAEWFRRLQWAWNLAQSSDRTSVAAGAAMMNYLADETDRKDAAVIASVFPLAREFGPLIAEYPGRAIGADLYDIDNASAGSSRTGEEAPHEDGGSADGLQARD